MAKHKKRKLHLDPKASKARHSKKPTAVVPSKNALKSHSSSTPSGHKNKPPNTTQSLTTPTIPFHQDDRILLVGEGDFSFARALVDEHGCYHLTATCFDSEAQLQEKYPPQGPANVAFLLEQEQLVLYAVDATKLDSTKALVGRSGLPHHHGNPRSSSAFDVIMFNFPHVGGKSTDVNRQVRFNQELLVKFFAAAKALLAPGVATIVVTLFEGEPYTLWNIRDLARHAGLVVLRSFRFDAAAYPGYAHARTLGNLEGGGGWKGEERSARSYVFGRKDVEASSAASPAAGAGSGARGSARTGSAALPASAPKRKGAPRDDSDDDTDDQG